MSGGKSVNLLTKEECVIKQSPHRVSQQPVGGVGRVPEEQSRQRDDQATVRASDGERDRVRKRSPELVSSSVWNSAQTS